MNHKKIVIVLSMAQNFLYFILLVVCITGCSALKDNATIIAYELESAADELKSQPNGSTYLMHYEPRDTTLPFTLLFFNEDGIKEADLLQKGLDTATVKDLYPQLSYINLKSRATCIVYQNGMVSFTTYYREFVDVKDDLVISGKGKIAILVKKIGVAPYHKKEEADKEIILIEMERGD